MLGFNHLSSIDLRHKSTPVTAHVRVFCGPSPDGQDARARRDLARGYLGWIVPVGSAGLSTRTATLSFRWRNLVEVHGGGAVRPQGDLKRLVDEVSHRTDLLQGESEELLLQTKVHAAVCLYVQADETRVYRLILVEVARSGPLDTLKSFEL